jgi:hypothetical protein
MPIEPGGKPWRIQSLLKVLEYPSIKDSNMRRLALLLPAVLSAGVLVIAQDPPPGGRSIDHLIPPARHFDEKPPVHFELISSTDQPGRALVTNTYQANLTAFVIQVGSDIDNPKPSTPSMLLFDALARQGMISTISRGLSLTTGVPHFVGKEAPPAKLVAALWEDGSTFGRPDTIDKLLDNRRATLAAYDLVIPILQTALDANWTTGEYIDALEREKVPLPHLTEPPSIGIPFQPNTQITAVEMMLRHDQSATSPPLFFKAALTRLKKCRDDLAAALPNEETMPADTKSRF